MTTASIAAAQAYAQQARSLEQAGQGASGGAAPGGFAELLGSALESTQATGQAADAGMAAQAVGKAEMVDVVTAVAEAELTVQTIVAVRDRVISAYQEILRMPI